MIIKFLEWLLGVCFHKWTYKDKIITPFGTWDGYILECQKCKKRKRVAL